jgi:hypothetical protein
MSVFPITYDKVNTILESQARFFFTAIPYRVSTGPEQGFPCVVFPHMEKPVFSSWDCCNEKRFFSFGNTTQGKPCFHYREGFAVLGSKFLNVLLHLIFLHK